MADQFTIKVSGLEELARRFSKAPQIVEPILREAIEKSKVVIDHHRLDTSNVPQRTGELARRWSTSYGKLSLTTKPDVEYARAVEFGLPASPGRYVPAIGKRLVNGPNIGMWPGFKGRHFMEKIIAASRGEINELFRNAITVVKSEMQKL